MWFVVFVLGLPWINANQPYAKCTIISEYVNASADMLLPNLDSVFNICKLNVTFYLK